MVPYIDKAISYMNIPIDEVELSFLERAIKTVLSEQKMKHEIEPVAANAFQVTGNARYFFQRSIHDGIYRFPGTPGLRGDMVEHFL